jgi:acetoin utilization deacetylase AcuC-like enzyme
LVFKGFFDEEKSDMLLERFQPLMLFISTGFDAHREDDKGGFGLCDADYGWLTEQLKNIANRYTSRRIVSVLEGGYLLHALWRSATRGSYQMPEYAMSASKIQICEHPLRGLPAGTIPFQLLHCSKII